MVPSAQPKKMELSDEERVKHWTKGGFTSEWTEQDHTRFHQTTQNSAQFKIDKLFISGILHLLFQTTVDHW